MPHDPAWQKSRRRPRDWADRAPEEPPVWRWTDSLRTAALIGLIAGLLIHTGLTRADQRSGDRLGAVME